MKKLSLALFALAFAVLLQAPLAQSAQAASATSTSSTDVTTLMATLQSLLAKVADLRSQITAVQGQVHDTITSSIHLGMTSDQVKQIQQLLATDKSIYPEGITSGYFGDLTKQALERFQAKHGLPKSGEVDQNTQDLLNQYLGQRFGTSTIPKGLLTAPGIVKKVQDNICGKEGHNGGAWGVFCKNYIGTSTANHNDDDNVHPFTCALNVHCDDRDLGSTTMDHATSTVDHGITVSVTISTSTATSSAGGCGSSAVIICPWKHAVAKAIVTFTYDKINYIATPVTTSKANVLKAVADAMSTTPDKLNPVLVRLILKDLEAARAEAHVW